MTSLPWDTISKPELGYVWRKAPEGSRHAFWWGKDSNALPVLLFQLNNDHLEGFKNARPRVNGLDIDMVAVEGGRYQGLIISLNKASDADLFHRLCIAVIQAAEAVESETQAVQSVLNHLDRWREFLSTARRSLLSAEEIRGLFAELVTIRALIEEYGRVPSEIISGWQGPLDRPQDFQFTTGFVEVKAVGGTTGDRVKISSEFQLDVQDKPIFLTAVELFEDKNSTTGMSLIDLVKQTEERLDAETGRLFRDRLTVGGYIERDEYNLPIFVVGKIRFYHAADGFPSIVAGNLPYGVASVRYSLDLNTAQTFLISRLPIWEGENS